MRAPRQTLSVVDAVGIIVGIVVGAGIFKTPSIVAANATSKTTFLLLWPLGGAISLCAMPSWPVLIPAKVGTIIISGWLLGPG